MTWKLILALVVGFCISSAVGAVLVPYLRKIKAGQAIREDGPTWHMSKTGTPTMGGLMFIIAVTVVCLTVGFSCMANGEWGHIFILVFGLVFGAIGFLDDYEKLRHKQNLGLSAKMKFLLQLLAATCFLLLLRFTGYLSPNLYIPFWNTYVPVSEPLYFIFAAFVIVGTVNAVNITDGVDGLAAGTCVPVFLCFTAIVFCWGKEYMPQGIFASGMVGALLGFLIYNFNPARVFMGDTGYFKLSHGKRVFKMAPFHHHLEMGGWTGRKWKEKEIFVLFAGITFVMAVVSLLGVTGRYSF